MNHNCDGLMSVLDWLAPTDQPFRKGVMLGFDARHTRAHCYRSILEAIALTMKDKVDAMADELGTELREIVISGGGSSSPLFMQIFADVFGIPASRAHGPGGASLVRQSVRRWPLAYIRISRPPSRAWKSPASRSHRIPPIPMSTAA